MNVEKTERFISQNISLPIGLRNEVAKEAKRRNLSISGLIRIALIKEIRAKQLQEGGNASK